MTLNFLTTFSLWSQASVTNLKIKTVLQNSLMTYYRPLRKRAKTTWVQIVNKTRSLKLPNKVTLKEELSVLLFKEKNNLFLPGKTTSMFLISNRLMVTQFLFTAVCFQLKARLQQERPMLLQQKRRLLKDYHQFSKKTRFLNKKSSFLHKIFFLRSQDFHKFLKIFLTPQKHQVNRGP